MIADHHQERPTLTLVPARSRRAARRPWTGTEDAVLRAGYARGALDDLSTALDRTRSAIHQRARVLGLSRPAPSRRWTAADNAVLRELHGVLPQAGLATHLGRTRAAVMMQIKRLGLDRHRSAITRYQRDRAEIAQLRAGATLSDDARKLATLIAWRLLVISAEQAAVVLGVPVERLPVELGRAAKRGLDVVTQALEGT